MGRKLKGPHALDVSKTDALRRAVQPATRTGSSAPDAVAALEKVQRSMALDADAATTWARRTRTERLAAANCRNARR